MKRRTQKRQKSHLKHYTALVPKTIKATKAVGTAAVKRINYYINSTKKTIKKTTDMINKTSAKSIRSLSKLRKRM